MSKIILKGQEAREALKRGVDLVADCVKLTLGPSGRNAVLGRRNITPIITNDGVTIAHNIEAEDPIEQQGVLIVREAAQLTDSNAGDGTTTTTVLLQKITDKLFSLIKDDGSLVRNKVNTIDLKKELDIWCDKVCEQLKKQSRPITNDDIYNVALVSAEYDWIAKIITDIFIQIGKDGYVSIEEGVKNEYEVFKGMELNVGFPSEYFINNDKRQCVIEKPHILVTNQALEIGAILPVVEEMSKDNITEIILVAPDFTRDLINRLNTTKVKTGLSIIALKLPTLGKDDLLIDLSTLTNAKFLDKNIYTKYEDLAKEIKLSNFGIADKIIIGDSKTIVMGGNGDTSNRVEEIRKTLASTESVFDKDILEKRIAYLSGGLAVIKISAESEFEKTYFKLKMEDAVNAVQVSLKDGVVKGGGLALKKVSEALDTNQFNDCLLAPYNQIQENCGKKLEIPDNVIDPVKITISAIKSACSLAGMLLTTEIAIAYKNDEEITQNHD
jgi:chaperonin GroEL